MRKKRPAVASIFAASTLTLLLSSSAWAESKPGANWPSFRGKNAAGVADGFATPAEFSVPAGKNLLWKTAIPGLGHSSPIVWGDRVYVVTAFAPGDAAQPSLRTGLYGDIASVPEDAELKWDLLALDKATGKVVWQKTLHQGKPAVKRHTKATHANSTAATDGERIAVFLGSEGLHVLDMEGKLLWKKDYGKLESSYFAAPEAQWGFASSPIFHGNKLIAGADVLKGSFIAAYDAKTGAELWKTDRDDVPTWSTPTVVTEGGAPQVVVNGFKKAAGYDLETGKLRWTLSGGGDIPVPTPIAGHGLIYLASAHGPASPIFAIKAGASGDISLPDGVSQSEHVAWSYNRGGSYMQTPLLYGDLLYVCRDAGVLTVYKAASGEQVYQQRLAGGQTGFTASGVAADGKIYYTAETGDVFVVKAGPVFELLGKGELGEQALATPAVSEGRLYFRTPGSVIAVGHPPAAK